MNQYHNIIGYHTPIESERHFNTITEATKIEYLDSSWHNDLCDSMLFYLDESEEKFIEIYLPNSIEDSQENEEFNTFQITDETREELFLTTDINEVIKFIKDNKYKNKINAS